MWPGDGQINDCGPVEKIIHQTRHLPRQLINESTSDSTFMESYMTKLSTFTINND